MPARLATGCTFGAVLPECARASSYRQDSRRILHPMVRAPEMTVLLTAMQTMRGIRPRLDSNLLTSPCPSSCTLCATAAARFSSCFS